VQTAMGADVQPSKPLNLVRRSALTQQKENSHGQRDSRGGRSDWDIPIMENFAQPEGPPDQDLTGSKALL